MRNVVTLPLIPEALRAAFATERVRLVAAKECRNAGDCWKKKLADKDTRVREPAALELGWLGAADAVPELLKIADEENAEVRMAAVRHLEAQAHLAADEQRRRTRLGRSVEG